MSGGNGKIEKREPEVQIVPAGPPTPTSILLAAVERGADVETLAKLLELQERFEANEARKAFIVALAAFKANPPKLEKTKEVAYKDVRYRYTPLDECASIIGPALAQHGLSYRWETKQVDGRISVTCLLQHKQGHTEGVTLEAAPDTSGSKNSIQGIGSTVTYLQRYTLLAITGLATANQDTDGLAMDNNQVADLSARIEGAGNLNELDKIFKEAKAAAVNAKSVDALNHFGQVYQRRAKELRAA